MHKGRTITLNEHSRALLLPEWTKIVQNVLVLSLAYLSRKTTWALSVACRRRRRRLRKLFTFLSSSSEPISHFQPNLAQSIFGRIAFKLLKWRTGSCLRWRLLRTNKDLLVFFKKSLFKNLWSRKKIKGKCFIKAQHEIIPLKDQ